MNTIRLQVKRVTVWSDMSLNDAGEWLVLPFYIQEVLCLSLGPEARATLYFSFAPSVVTGKPWDRS